LDRVSIAGKPVHGCVMMKTTLKSKGENFWDEFASSLILRPSVPLNHLHKAVSRIGVSARVAMRPKLAIPSDKN
jgi:hypothetical protein